MATRSLRAPMLSLSLPLTVRFFGRRLEASANTDARSSSALFWLWAAGLLLYPMIEWMLPLPGNRTLPVGDAWMVVVFVLWLIGFLRSRQLRKIPMGVFVSFLFFCVVALASLFFSPEPSQSLFYFFRFIVLNFVLYILLPLQMISTRAHVKAVVWILILIGAFGSAMGLVSLLVRPEYVEVLRATPLRLGGIFPIGQTPNLLAELLLPVLPITWGLWVIHRHPTQQRVLAVLFVMNIVIGLLTFSRAGWLSMLVVLGLLVWLFYSPRNLRRFGTGMKRLTWIAGLVLLPLIMGMLVFLQNPIVESSNENRLYLQEISMRMFHRHPWVGSGIGTFKDHVDTEKYYQLQFGGSLDAHGIPQKLLAETGALGLVMFLVFLSSILATMFFLGRTLEGKDYILALAFVVASVGISMSQLFNTTYFTPKLWLPLGVGLASVINLYEQRSTATTH